MCGDALLGAIDVAGGDFPWLNGRLVPTAEFERFRSLFEDELRLLDHVDDSIDEWEAAYGRIRDSGISLMHPDGHAAAEFLLHIDGSQAWFRWSDEPLTPDPDAGSDG